MKGMLTTSLLLLVSQAFSQNGRPLSVGETFELESAPLKEKRTINIFLPEGYHESDTVRYPVIYLLDGGINQDFLHVTGIVQFYTQPWIERFPRSIVVGIESANRKKDFTFPVNDLGFLGKMGFKKDLFPQYGGSPQYIAFLEKELQPYIEKHYKTGKGRTVIGESMAGLLATEILLKHPELFDTYIIMSPSLWWGAESLLKEAPGLLKQPVSQKLRVYIGACNKEEDKTMYEDAEALKKVLIGQGGRNRQVFYDYLPDETHATLMHQAVCNAFRLLYPLKK